MTPKPKVYTIPFLLKLTPAQHANLREAAEAEGVSMGAVLRDAFEVWMWQIGPIAFEVSAPTDDGAEAQNADQ